MSYARKNLREIEDVAIKHGLSDSQEARFPRADLGAEQTGVNYLTSSLASARLSLIGIVRRRRSTLSWPVRGGSS